MSQPNLGALRAVADRLDSLGLDYAFVGGSIVNLLLDNPALSPVRPTDDLDVILEAVTAQRYSEISQTQFASSSASKALTTAKVSSRSR